MFIDFRGRGWRERERDTSMWVRNIAWLPPICSPAGDRTCNLGMCPDQESTLQHFGVWDDALMRTLAHSVCGIMDEMRQIHMDYRNPVEEKGWHSPSLREREGWPHPLPGQAFFAFLGTLHWGWSSFTMHRFALGGYLLQKTKERMLLITSKKKDFCKCKWKSGWIGYTCPWEV